MNLRDSLRRIRAYAEWDFDPPQVEVRRPMVRLGSEHASYFVDPTLISSDSIVYSAGVGKDISFDRDLAARWNVCIEAFDPTPRVRTWLETQPLPRHFRFHPVGLAERDGEANFHLPLEPQWISHSAVSSSGFRQESVALPVRRLSSVLADLGHLGRRIGLLKLDIEGAEYAVIEEMLREGIVPEQLLVEFHHRFLPGGIAKTRQALGLLRSAELQIAHVCPRFEVFTFVATDALARMEGREVAA